MNSLHAVGVCDIWANSLPYPKNVREETGRASEGLKMNSAFSNAEPQMTTREETAGCRRQHQPDKTRTKHLRQKCMGGGVRDGTGFVMAMGIQQALAILSHFSCETHMLMKRKRTYRGNAVR